MDEAGRRLSASVRRWSPLTLRPVYTLSGPGGSGVHGAFMVLPNASSSSELPLIQKVDTENSVLIARRHGGPFRIERPLHLDDFAIRIVQCGGIGKRKVARDPLLQSQARGRY